MFGINWETAKSLLAKLLAIVGTYVMAKYGISSGTWEAIAGIVVTVASLLWSIKANTPTSLALAAGSQPGLTVLAPPAVAAAAQSNDVKSSAEVKIVAK